MAVQNNREEWRFEGRDIVVRGWRTRRYDSRDALEFRVSNDQGAPSIELVFKNGGALSLHVDTGPTDRERQNAIQVLNSQLASAQEHP
jgi:hypothetical protein